MSMQDNQKTTDGQAAPQELVRCQIDGGTASLVLDRPRAINALGVAMMDTIDARLHEWRDDPQVERVEIRGEGERGFCAGADVREIRTLVLEDPQQAVDFFTQEYGVNQQIASYPKPVTSYLHGISMGGGLGLALHAGRVLATDDLALAMPEVGIGLFPDVGITWQLAKAPGQTGVWLAMTGTTIDAASARWMGLVHQVEGLGDDAPCAVAEDQPWIDECFTGDDAAQILERLEAHSEPRARECAELVRQKSPWSVCVALEAIRRAGGMSSVDEVLAQDLALARNFVADSDFVEGVRAQLVDKDRNPQWRHARVEDVPRELVLGMFR
ncbi:enoyl-CoA hydratase/isomerase family protein [Luteococcus sp. Sow4_B9]|uniref:enoyl-CoA hydratase/isomerase family protein n=1 Tax=Luteococcus sp. Sow4_B9 TaxID=3438792 RepID=UPI003F9E41DA